MAAMEVSYRIVSRAESSPLERSCQLLARSSFHGRPFECHIFVPQLFGFQTAGDDLEATSFEIARSKSLKVSFKKGRIEREIALEVPGSYLFHFDLKQQFLSQVFSTRI